MAHNNNHQYTGVFPPWNISVERLAEKATKGDEVIGRLGDDE